MRLSIWSRALLAALLLALPGAPTRVRAQTPGHILGPVSPENASLYLAPLARALAHASAGGVLPGFQAQPLFGMRLGVTVVGAVVPEGSRRFQPHRPASVAFAGSTHAEPFEAAREPTPAASGQGPGVRLRPSGSFESAILSAGGTPETFALQLPRGLDLAAPWTPHLEATLGLGLGTDLVARFSPTVAWTAALGDVSSFGVTLLHGLGRHLGLTGSRWDARLTAGLHRTRAGGYLATHASTLGLAAGGRVGSWEVYAHGRLEKTRGVVTYEAWNPAANPALPPHGAPVRADVPSHTAARLGLGAQVHLPRLLIAVEVSPGELRTMSARVALAGP